MSYTALSQNEMKPDLTAIYGVSEKYVTWINTLWYFMNTFDSSVMSYTKLLCGLPSNNGNLLYTLYATKTPLSFSNLQNYFTTANLDIVIGKMNNLLVLVVITNKYKLVHTLHKKTDSKSGNHFVINDKKFDKIKKFPHYWEEVDTYNRSYVVF